MSYYNDIVSLYPTVAEVAQNNNNNNNNNMPQDKYVILEELINSTPTSFRAAPSGNACARCRTTSSHSLMALRTTTKVSVNFSRALPAIQHSAAPRARRISRPP